MKRLRYSCACMHLPDWMAMKASPPRTARALPIFFAAAPEQYPTIEPKVSFAM